MFNNIQFVLQSSCQQKASLKAAVACRKSDVYCSIVLPGIKYSQVCTGKGETIVFVYLSKLYLYNYQSVFVRISQLYLYEYHSSICIIIKVYLYKDHNCFGGHQIFTGLHWKRRNNERPIGNAALLKIAPIQIC